MVASRDHPQPPLVVLAAGGERSSEQGPAANTTSHVGGSGGGGGGRQMQAVTAHRSQQRLQRWPIRPYKSLRRWPIPPHVAHTLPMYRLCLSMVTLFMRIWEHGRSGTLPSSPLLPLSPGKPIPHLGSVWLQWLLPGPDSTGSPRTKPAARSCPHKHRSPEAGGRELLGGLLVSSGQGSKPPFPTPRKFLSHLVAVAPWLQLSRAANISHVQ